MDPLSQVRQGRFLREICDCIFGKYHSLFIMMVMRDMINYASEHLALRTRILQLEEVGQQCGIGGLPAHI